MKIFVSVALFISGVALGALLLFAILEGKAESVDASLHVTDTLSDGSTVTIINGPGKVAESYLDSDGNGKLNLWRVNSALSPRDEMIYSVDAPPDKGEPKVREIVLGPIYGDYSRMIDSDIDRDGKFDRREIRHYSGGHPESKFGYADLNFDGVFDVRWQNEDGFQGAIVVDDAWTSVVSDHFKSLFEPEQSQAVETGRRTFIFDSDSGKWLSQK